MAIYLYISAAIFAVAGFLLCWELVIHQKVGINVPGVYNFGAVTFFLRICVLLLLIIGTLLSGWNIVSNSSPDYFSIAFPLVDRNHSDYLSDIEFVQPKNSDQYEAIGYSWYEHLFVTIAKDSHEVQFFPDTDYEWYLNIAESHDNIDGFIGGWAEGLISPYDEHTFFKINR